jgi:uncharacterized protein involved in type VI secretion and phage assembly
MRPIYDLASVFAEQIRTAESEAYRVYEPMIAIVTDNKDPDKLGRVRIKFPDLSDQDKTWWAPIVMLGAGKNRGWFFIPEKDDEVLVLFEHGDMNRPLVVGSLWNGKDKPPDKNGGGNPRRMIKSRAGSKITFDDEKNSITIEDGGGKGVITFDAEKNKITIEAKKGDVCFQAPTGDITINAKEIEMTATKSIEIHAGSNMSWGCDAGVTIQSPAVTMSGSKENHNCGNASAPPAPSTTPQATNEPYKS